MQKMSDSGYGHSSRVEVIKSAVTKFQRQLLIQETVGKRFYQSREDMTRSRRLKNLENRTWFNLGEAQPRSLQARTFLGIAKKRRRSGSRKEESS